MVMATETKVVALTEGEAVVSGRDDLFKYGETKEGFKPDESRPVFIYEGIKKGVVTDGFSLIESSEAAQEIFGKHIEKERKKQIRWIKRIRPGITDEEAETHAEKDIKSREGGTFPNYKQLYPSKLQSELKVIGYGAGEGERGGYKDITAVAYLSDGDYIIPVDADRLAHILKYLPRAKIMLSGQEPVGWQKKENMPLTFVVNGENKGLLMPLDRAKLGIPEEIQRASGLSKAEKGEIQSSIQPRIAKHDKPYPDISYRNFLKAYDSKEEAHKAVLEGHKNIAEAKEYAKGMRDDDVTFTAKGIPIDKKVILAVVAKETKLKPEKGKAKLALPKLRMPKTITSYKEWAELKQSPRGKATDDIRLHSVVIEPDSPRVKRWLKDPGTADIRGVDTPRISKRSKRITPKTPRLKR